MCVLTTRHMHLFMKKEFLPIYNIYFIVDKLFSPVLTLLSHFTVVRLQISEQNVSRLKRLTSITCEQARNGLLFGANGYRNHSKPKSSHTCAQAEQWKCQSFTEQKLKVKKSNPSRSGRISVWWQRFSLLKREITALEIAPSQLTISIVVKPFNCFDAMGRNVNK